MAAAEAMPAAIAQPQIDGKLADETLGVGVDQMGHRDAFEDAIGVDAHFAADDVGREHGDDALVARSAGSHRRLGHAGHAGVDRGGHAELRAIEHVVGQETVAVHLEKLPGRAADLETPFRDRQVHLDAAAEVGAIFGVDPLGQREHLGHAHLLQGSR